MNASKLEKFEILVAIAYAISLPISLSASEVLLVIGLVLCTVSFFIRRSTGLTEVQPILSKLPPLTVPLLILSAGVTISGAFNGGAKPGELGAGSLAEAWRSLFSLKTLLPYFWASSIFGRSQTCRRVCVFLILIVSAVAGIWGTIQQIFDIHPGYKYLQGTGFLAHPMAFAGQMQIFSLLALGILFTRGYAIRDDESSHPLIRNLFSITKHPAIFVLIVVANLSGLFFAGERSAWVGGIVGIVAIATLLSWKMAVKAMSIIAATAGLSWVFVPLVRNRIDTMFSGHDVSITVRQQIWGECLKTYFPQSPLFGIGWLKFPHFDIPEAIVPGVSKDINHAHSNYIHVLTTAGLLGLICFVVLILSTLKAALDRFRLASQSRDDFESGIALGIFGAAVSLAVSGIFEYNFYTAQVRLAQWFVFGLL